VTPRRPPVRGATVAATADRNQAKSRIDGLRRVLLPADTSIVAER